MSFFASATNFTAQKWQSSSVSKIIRRLLPNTEITRRIMLTTPVTIATRE
jgi:hypothetical protein